MLSYVLMFALAWVIIGLIAPREVDPDPEAIREYLSFWESFLSYLRTGVVMFLLIGTPTIVIVVVAGIFHRKMEPPIFRAVVTVLTLLPTWFLLFSNTVQMLLLQVAAQVAFTTLVMPVPLIPRSEAQRAPKG
ncbi:hypothetical protein [Streptomyces syringium]|uniref:hypothetical protein n=1 Tax=Streptomyces syringium TaxID=76729 RepID=UPI0037D4D0A5